MSKLIKTCISKLVRIWRFSK